MAFADLERVQIQPDTLSLIPAELCREWRVLPVKRDGNTLWLALHEPGSAAIQRVKDATGLRVIPVMCVPKALDDALARL